MSWAETNKRFGNYHFRLFPLETSGKEAALAKESSVRGKRTEVTVRTDQGCGASLSVAGNGKG